MRSTQQLKTLITSAGGTMEEDDGYRDMRVLQAVAPDGYWWANERVQCMRIEWATGGTPTARAFNQHAYNEARQRLAGGLEPIPAEYADQYSND